MIPLTVRQVDLLSLLLASISALSTTRSFRDLTTIGELVISSGAGNK